MVRAAASGAIDYTQADPEDINWRIRHALLLREVRRRDDLTSLDVMQRHWCGYVGHGRLTEESYKNVSKHENEIVSDYMDVMFPWPKPEQKSKEAAAQTENKPLPEATIDPDTAKLIAAYKERFGKKDE